GQTLQVRPTSLSDLDEVDRILAELTGVRPVRDNATGLLTAPVSDPVLLSTLVRRLDSAGITSDELALRLPSLDEVFLALTGHTADEPKPERELEGSRS
ncbi:daunorubicin/doxorubicin resistance ABC transporter ATP-binding protein DrrA, partial [Amycolatopsis sp. NPDC000740]